MCRYIEWRSKGSTVSIWKEKRQRKKITRRMRYVGNSVRVYFSRVKKKKMQRKTREKERERERETRLTQTNVCVSVYIVELHLLKRNFVN